ncbi:TetR/AcrR family transcriptional regulator [Marinoscillum sp. MHG1-6]|uniref:TetR/AcrR family transcriptional regulator n=1 Tax=Marinoscillum sp. MHG1-6 TaxID=2959627 RepID=UPI0021575BF4|nr:TetR/AcrR family transcriptional regulator [Marinoscillum sp. MHG1-6]
MTAIQLRLDLNKNLFLRDPQNTELGKRIVGEGTQLISEIGFEGFTFKKLSERISSTEASIYRYFENKHRLLVYLIARYWAWIEFKIDYETNNLIVPQEKLEAALRVITHRAQADITFPEIDEGALQKIVIAETDKIYLTKQVDQDNQVGLFKGYKSICKKISDIMLEINPGFKYSRALSSTLLEASHQQIFFSQHLKSLTEIDANGDPFQQNYEFMKTLLSNALNAEA